MRSKNVFSLTRRRKTIDYHRHVCITVLCICGMYRESRRATILVMGWVKASIGRTTRYRDRPLNPANVPISLAAAVAQRDISLLFIWTDGPPCASIGSYITRMWWCHWSWFVCRGNGYVSKCFLAFWKIFNLLFFRSYRNCLAKHMWEYSVDRL